MVAFSSLPRRLKFLGAGRCVAVWATIAMAVTLAGRQVVGATDVNRARPNVVVFLVDDMGWMDCGAYGSQYYETPAIDAFARRAMRFTNAYAQPLCSPTRASLLTAQYSARHRITGASGHRPPQPPDHVFLPERAAADVPMLIPESKTYLEPSQYTLAEALRDAGYRTGHFGKWHLGTTPPHWPEQQGFETAFHCHPDPGPPGAYFSPYGVAATGTPTYQRRTGTITDGPPGEYIVDRLAAEAERFIAANRDRPFFLNLWNYGVHGPWGHKPEYTAAFQGKVDPRGVQGNPIMASMLRSVDECFGSVTAALERHGLSENTIILFLSDNGGNTHSNTPGDKGVDTTAKAGFMEDWRKWAGNRPPTSNAPLRDGKGTLYEGGTRVPCMWSWPTRIATGSTNDTVVGHIDVYPTLLDLLGLPRPMQQRMDGMSYAPILLGTGAVDWRPFFLYHPQQGYERAGGCAVRVGDWKLIRWFAYPPDDAGRYELYYLRDDLGEQNNRASAETNRVRELDAAIDRFLAETGATYPRPNPDYTGPAPRSKMRASAPK